jgi:hypothetical protein
MKFVTALRTLPREAGKAFLRTPIEVLLGAATWLGLTVAIERSQAEGASLQLAISVGIALPLVYAMSILFATGTISRWVRWGAAGAVVTAAALYGFHRFDPVLAAEGWRAALLIATAVLALLAVPLITRPEGPPDAGPLGGAPPDSDPDDAGLDTNPAQRRRRAWVHLFAMRLALRVALVGLYAAALYAGLAAALAAINGLFALELPDRMYAHLAALVYVFLPPWAVAAGLPELVAPPAPWGATTLLVLRRTAHFLLAPLIAVYLAIVYAYAVRMLMTGEVPSNLISPVVLGAGALTLAATLLLEPLHGHDDAVGLSRFVRLLPALLLPLAGLALWAVLIRVGQHGWTEFRYIRVMAVLLLGAFAAAGSWRLARGLRPPLATLPAVSAVLVGIMAIGPLSATSLSFRSQQARLQALLPATERSAANPVPVATAAFEEITSRAGYLRDHFGWDALQPLLAPDGTRPDNRATATLAASLGLMLELDTALPIAIYVALSDGAGIPGVDGGTIYPVDYQYLARGQQPPPVPARPQPAHPGTVVKGPGTGTLISVVLDSTGTRLAVAPPTGPTLTADLDDLVRQLTASARGETGEPVHEFNAEMERVEITGRSVQIALPPAAAIIPLHDPAGQPRGQLVLRRLTLRATGDSTNVENWGGFVVVTP